MSAEVKKEIQLQIAHVLLTWKNTSSGDRSCMILVVRSEAWCARLGREPLRRSTRQSEHSVTTVARRGWAGIKNGHLLALAEKEFAATLAKLEGAQRMSGRSSSGSLGVG
jgi:hypothetical protein